MRKTRKQLLGLAGLAAVIVMTVVAYGVPAPDAAAEGEPASSSGNMNLTVKVNEANTSIQIVSPRDNSITVDNIITVSTNFSETTKVEYYLTQKDSNGNESRINLPEYTPDQGNGTHSFNIDMDALGLDFGDVQLHAVAYGYNNTIREDTVAFNYAAVQATFEGAEENLDPILSVKLNGEVDYALIYVYKGDEPLLVDEDGQEVPIRVSKDDIDPATGKILTALPFEKYGAESGDYTAVVVAYNSADEIISMVTARTSYLTPEDAAIPEIPNTGSLRIGNLNITRLDYLLTGLIAFAAVAGFAIFLVCRKNRR